MSCKCQVCGRQYKVDLIVPDATWEKIKPAGKAPGAGLMCGMCIMERIEAMGEYGGITLLNKRNKMSTENQPKG
jgi:hypothetical protein